MADIISGSSRFNGDKNAPARKVIQMNNVSEAATHETEDDEIVKHRIKKHRRHMVIIAAIGVIVIAIAVVLVMRLIDGYVFTSYSVTGSLNREDIESSGYIAYGDGYIRYSNDGAAYYTAKGKALWNQTYSMQKPQVKICEDCVAIGDINGNTIYIFNKNGNIGKVDTSLVISQGTKQEKVISKKHISNLCFIGVPMGLQYSITAIGSTILQAAVNGLGSSYVAAMTAGSKMFNFTCCPFDALGSTMATYGGQNVGAGKIDRLGKGIKAAMLIGAVYSVVALVVLYFSADYIALLFVDAGETAIIELTRRFIMASALFYIPLTGVNVYRFCIQGMGFSVFAILAGVFEMLARTLVAILLIPHIGFNGACLANPAAWIAADLFLIPAFIHCCNKLKRYE